MNAKEFFEIKKYKNTKFLNTEIGDNLYAVEVWNFAEEFAAMKLEEVKQENKLAKSSVLSRLIDNVTVARLDMTLRMCGIELHRDIIDRVIDVVELIEDKGGDVKLSDISELKAEWKMA